MKKIIFGLMALFALAGVSTYFYRVTFKPSVIVPDVRVQ